MFKIGNGLGLEMGMVLNGMVYYVADLEGILAKDLAIKLCARFPFYNTIFLCTHTY